MLIAGLKLVFLFIIDKKVFNHIAVWENFYWNDMASYLFYGYKTMEAITRRR